MGGKSGGSPPPAPDPVATANAQAAANKETAIAQAQLNMINQYTPFGSLVYEQLPGTGRQFDQAGYDAALTSYEAQMADYNRKMAQGQGDPESPGPYYGMEAPKAPTRDSFFYGDETPRYQATQTLNPEEQARLDNERKLALQLLGLGQDQIGRIADRFGTDFTFDGMPAAPDLTTGTMERDAVTEALLARMQPQLDKDRQRLETSLMNRGFTPGTEAYQKAMDEFNRQKSDAYTSALLAGGQEQSRLFGLANTARNNAIQEALLERNIPLDELTKLMGTSGNANVPQFSAPPQTPVAGTDIIGPTYASYQGQLNAYNQQQANAASTRGAIFGALGNIGGSVLGAQSMPWIFSDRRLKRDIRRVGSLRSGIGVYFYRYVWGGPARLGVIAQEVATVMPAAVASLGGYLAVDYGRVLGEA